jgi:hypothetical protein
MSLFSSKKKPTLSFVFDIRDTSITIAAARLEKDNKPELVHCQNFKIENQDPADYEKHFDSIFKTIDNGVISLKRSLINMGNRENIGKYFFFVGSPWSVSESKMIKIIKDKAFEINNSLLGKIITGEEDSERKEIEKMKGMSGWGVLEEKIIQTKLNGYKTEVIYGKKTKELEIELFVSFIPQDIKNRLSSFESKILNKQKSGRLNSCTMSSYSFLRDLYSDKNDFICIDMGDFLTDAYVVRNDVIEANVTIPFGKKEIIESASIKAKMPEDILLSALHINSRGDDVNFAEKTNKIASAGIKVWLKTLNEFISRVCTGMNTPKNLFIIINDEFTRALVKEIKNNKQDYDLNILNSGTEVTGIEENVLDGHITNAKVYKNEPHIKMDMAFLDKIIYRV